MERKVGEIFEYNGEWYQCVRGEICADCTFVKKHCNENPLFEAIGSCSKFYRKDATSVIFKKLEKVGEPYKYYIKCVEGVDFIIVQEYILPNPSYIWNDEENVFTRDCYNGRIAIEIKQNKEDMEENHKAEDALLLTKLSCRYMNNLIDYETFEKAVKELYSDKKDSKPALKEFDLEAAKTGKPVCTRDGRKARIICFDLQADKPIVALITNDDIEEVHFYYDDGRSNQYQEYRYDLMMLPEKKEGWIIKPKDYQVYQSKTDAEEVCNKNYQVVAKITWEE